jgi:hypothetical protein
MGYLKLILNLLIFLVILNGIRADNKKGYTNHNNKQSSEEMDDKKTKKDDKKLSITLTCPPGRQKLIFHIFMFTIYKLL